MSWLLVLRCVVYWLFWFIYVGRRIDWPTGWRFAMYAMWCVYGDCVDQLCIGDWLVAFAFYLLSWLMNEHWFMCLRLLSYCVACIAIEWRFACSLVDVVRVGWMSGTCEWLITLADFMVCLLMCWRIGLCIALWAVIDWRRALLGFVVESFRWSTDSCQVDEGSSVLFGASMYFLRLHVLTVWLLALNDLLAYWLVDLLIGWLIDWCLFIDWLSELLVAWLIGWVFYWCSNWWTDWLADWFDWLVGWVTGCLVDWLSDWLVGWFIDLIDLLLGWFVCRSSYWLSGFVVYVLTGWLTGRSVYRAIDLLVGLLACGFSDRFPCRLTYMCIDLFFDWFDGWLTCVCTCGWAACFICGLIGWCIGGLLYVACGWLLGFIGRVIWSVYAFVLLSG